MTVPEPEHPWITALQRQRRFTLLGIVVCAAIVVGTMIFVTRLVLAGPITGIFGWPLVTALLILLLVVVPLPIVILRFLGKSQLHWAQQMIQSGGLMCPRCRISLDAGDPQDSVECRKCKQQFDVEDLREFWNSMVHDPSKATAWWIRNYSNTGVRGRLARFMFPDGRPRLWAMIAANAALWGIGGIVLAALSGTSLTIGAFTYSHMFLVMVGFGLFVAGRKSRVGDELFCSKCQYQVGPGLAQSPRCPECGFNWSTIGGKITGRLNRNRPLMATGLVAATLGALLIVAPLFVRGWQFKLLPTGPLIHQVLTKRGFTMDEWTELRLRTLSAEQVHRLATGLLDKRLAHPYFNGDEDNWIVAQITTGTIPDELANRYYREQLDIALIAPPRATVGKPITLQLDCTYRGAATNNPTAFVLMGGYSIDENQEPLARQAIQLAGISLDKKNLRGAKPATDFDFTPQRAGNVTVRARVWVIALPLGAGSQQIEWQPDGTPIIPLNAVWHEARELQTSIIVTD